MCNVSGRIRGSSQMEVIKIGGSLLKIPNKLKNFCKEVPKVRDYSDFIIIPGGGPFADLVRKFHAELEFSDSTAHYMAITSMDTYGFLLSDLIPTSKTVTTIHDAVYILKLGYIPILLPSRLILDLNTLEHSWCVTSDTISAYIASIIGLKRVILIKDVDGLYSEDPKHNETARLLKRVKASEISKMKSSCLDSALPEFLISNGMECIVLGPDISNLINVFRGLKFHGTAIVPE